MLGSNHLRNTEFQSAGLRENSRPFVGLAGGEGLSTPFARLSLATGWERGAGGEGFGWPAER